MLEHVVERWTNGHWVLVARVTTVGAARNSANQAGCSDIEIYELEITIGERVA